MLEMQQMINYDQKYSIFIDYRKEHKKNRSSEWKGTMADDSPSFSFYSTFFQLIGFFSFIFCL